jgi:hypothetical protein
MLFCIAHELQSIGTQFSVSRVLVAWIIGPHSGRRTGKPEITPTRLEPAQYDRIAQRVRMVSSMACAHYSAATELLGSRLRDFDRAWCPITRR